jgi:nitrite reductase (NADH) large subunit
MRRLVIIGNSAAGLAAIETIRSRDQRSRVTLIAAETHPPYSRIMLTYLLAGKVGRDDLFLEEPAWYERVGVEALVGRSAVGIDTRRQQVFTERSSGGTNSKRVPYDRLLIATGALAQRPALPGVELVGVFCLRDLDDAVSILRYADTHGLLGKPAEGLSGHTPAGKRGPRAVFLGGGPVCLHALTALANRGMRVTLAVRSPTILSQLTDPCTARLAEKVLRAGGVQIATGVDPVAIERRSSARSPRMMVHMRNGGHLPADMVIIGKGTRPNLELARGTDIATDAGILVDETMATSVPGVFAAGDVTQATHCVTGEKVCYGTWTNACEQGRIAGLNMIGSHAEWAGGLNRNVTALFGHTLGSVGVFHLPAGESRLARPHRRLHHYHDRRRNVSRRLAFRDGRCEGAVLWNACDDLGVLSSLISVRRDCSGWEQRLARGGATFADGLCMGLLRRPARRRLPEQVWRPGGVG